MIRSLLTQLAASLCSALFATAVWASPDQRFDNYGSHAVFQVVGSTPPATSTPTLTGQIHPKETEHVPNPNYGYQPEKEKSPGCGGGSGGGGGHPGCAAGSSAKSAEDKEKEKADYYRNLSRPPGQSVAPAYVIGGPGFWTLTVLLARFIPRKRKKS